jgi:aspartokinase
LTDTDRNPDAPIVVRKYGGSSLADIPRLKEVARDLRRARDEGLRLVVVVSAMGDHTNELTALARQANAEPPRRELDMLLTVGERITMSLLCMALAAEGVPAVSFTGSQAGIITDQSHTDARIVAVKPIRLPEALAAGKVVVVAGFQGVSGETKEITTLGRGGSDTTAVALAHALGARRCEILKDVSGVMTADPKRVTGARRFERLDYATMQRIADAGCGVVHPRAVDYAARHEVPLYVGSSFTDEPGTDVGGPVAPPRPPELTFHPLVVTVATAQARLMLGAPDGDPHPDLVDLARRASATGPLTGEWFAAGDRWFWEGWGTDASLAPVAEAARQLTDQEPDGAACHWEDGCGVVTLAGRRPENWCGALAELRSILAAEGLADAPVRTDGDAVRILVPAADPAALAQTLHDRLVRP